MDSSAATRSEVGCRHADPIARPGTQTHVYADSHDHGARTQDGAGALDQYPAELAPPAIKVIRPFDCHAVRTQALERLRGTYRHGEAHAPEGSGAPGKTPQNGESHTSSDHGDPGMSAPTAPGTLVFTSEHRAVRRAPCGTLGENGIGGRTFIEHLDAKLGRDVLQFGHERVRLEQVESLGQAVTAAAYLDYAQAQRFDPPDEVPDASAGKPQSPGEPLAGVKPAVGQHAKQGEVGCAHAQNREEKPDKY